MAQTEFESRDATLFLAMCWSGGGPFSLSDIHFVYDWVNRDILTPTEMEGGLNRLLAANLVEQSGDKFGVSRKIYDDFETFRKRRRQGRFKDASSFLKQFEPLPKVTRQVRISENRWKKAYDDYRKRFWKAHSKRKSMQTKQQTDGKTSRAQTLIEYLNGGCINGNRSPAARP